MSTYEVRKNNGVFHVFNTFLYRPIAAYTTEQEAQDHVDHMVTLESPK